MIYHGRFSLIIVLHLHFSLCASDPKEKKKTLRSKCVKQDARRWEMCVRGGGMMGADEGETEKS